MRTLKILLVFNLIIGSSFILFAQVPGYMGKRTSVYITSGIAPNFLNIDFVPPSTPFDISYGLGIDHVVAKKISVGLEYRRLNSFVPFDFDNTFEEVENKGRDYYYASKTNVLKFSVASTTFKSDYLAPVGKYFSANVLFLTYNVYDAKNHIFGDNYRFYRGGTMATGLTFGNKYILGDRLIFDYSISSAYIIVDFEPANSDGSSLRREMFKSVNSRLQNYFIINGSVSLGYLF